MFVKTPRAAVWADQPVASAPTATGLSLAERAAARRARRLAAARDASNGAQLPPTTETRPSMPGDVPVRQALRPLRLPRGLCVAVAIHKGEPWVALCARDGQARTEWQWRRAKDVLTAAQAERWARTGFGRAG